MKAPRDTLDEDRELLHSEININFISPALASYLGYPPVHIPLTSIVPNNNQTNPVNKQSPSICVDEEISIMLHLGGDKAEMDWGIFL